MTEPNADTPAAKADALHRSASQYAVAALKAMDLGPAYGSPGWTNLHNCIESQITVACLTLHAELADREAECVQLAKERDALRRENGILRESWGIESAWKVVGAELYTVLIDGPGGDRRRVSMANPEEFDRLAADNAALRRENERLEGIEINNDVELTRLAANNAALQDALIKCRRRIATAWTVETMDNDDILSFIDAILEKS